MAGAESDALLSGETPETRDTHEAERWRRVYAALVAALRELNVETGGRNASSAATEARYQRRLAFWQQRARELGTTSGE